jgi:hypothetical protein
LIDIFAIDVLKEKFGMKYVGWSKFVLDCKFSISTRFYAPGHSYEI